MATLRDKPVPQFNFLVNLGLGTDPGSYDGGFQEISGIGMEVAISEYRNGNERENFVRKIGGLNKVDNVTLKRGVIGSLTLYKWLHQIRSGEPNMQHNVTIELLSENRVDTVMTWKLMSARITKHTCGPLNAKGTDVAMEEMVLAYERLEIE